MHGHQSAVAINLSVFLLMVGVGLIVALLPQRILSLTSSVADVGILASAYAIPNVLLQIPIGRLSDRLGFKAFLVAGYLLCALTGVLYFLADTPVLYFGGRFLQGIAEVPIWALAPALLSIQYAADKGTYMGLYNASLHCGLTLGGLSSIVVSRIWQANEPFLLFALTSFLGALIIALGVKNPRRRPTAGVETAGPHGTRSLAADRTNLIVFAGITVYGAGYGVFITIVPAFLIDAASAGPAMVGGCFASFYIALSLSQLLAGAWSDRRGRKPAMLAGLTLAASGMALFHRFQPPPRPLRCSPRPVWAWACSASHPWPI